METATLLWAHLGVLTRQRYQAIMDVYGSLDDAAKHLGPELLKSLGCKQETIERVLPLIDEFDPKKFLEILRKEEIVIVAIDDPRYPKRLFETADAPVFLFIRGNLDVFNEPSLALVGTRQMSQYGKRVTQAFVEPIANAGIVTVSGLAFGVDTLVAEETLKAGGKTIAVVAHGLHMIHPSSNKKLAEEILKKGGAIVSEEPLGTPPDIHLFPKRNRIIAGLSMGTVVLEAPEGSGALITAREAISESRDVFVVPGQIFDPQYAGSHAFLSSGQAKLVTSAEEVLKEYGVAATGAKLETSFVPENDLEAAVYAALSALPQPVDDLVVRSKRAPAEIGSALTMLELNGAAKNLGNGMWVRS